MGDREKTYMELVQQSIMEDEALHGKVYEQTDPEKRVKKQDFRVAVHAIRAALPSHQLHKQPEGVTIARQQAMALRRKNTVTPVQVKSAAMASDRRESVASETLRKAESKGLKLEYKDDEEVDEVDRMKQLEVIKQMPVPLATKIKLRDKLYERMPEVKKDCCEMCVYNTRVRRARWKKRWSIRWREFQSHASLWSTAFKRIEGHFGAGVLTYFKFLKWMFQLNILLFLLVLLFLILPEALLTDQSYSDAVTGDANYTVAQLTAAVCSEQYVVNVSSDAVELIIDFLQGTGWMEKTVMFYGEYSDRTLTAFANWNYNMPLAYIVILACIYLFSLIIMVHNTAKGFREMMFSREETTKGYCNRVFAAWDFGMDNPKNADLRQNSICRQFGGYLEQERYLEKIAKRTTKEKCKVWTIRIIINFIIICLLGGAAFLIYYATKEMTALQKSADYVNMDYFVQLLVGYTPSLTITVLNSVLPIVFNILVKFEDYSNAWTLNMCLIRRVFLRLASLALLMFTLYSEISCTPKDSTCNVGQSPDCTSLECWETHVGQQLYKLVITDFLTVVCVTFLVEFPRKLFVTKCPCGFCKKIGLQQFDITKNVLDLIYGESLLWLGTFFCPMIPIITVIKNFLVFYIKQASLLYCCEPQKAMNSSANEMRSFVFAMYIFSFILCAMPVHYVVFRMTPSKGCGPFRIYDRMYDILPLSVDNFPTVLREILDWVFSAMILIPLFIILCLIIYYKDQMLGSYREMITKLKEQVLMEGRDKQFLMEQLHQAAGGQEKKSPKKSVPAGEAETQNV